MWNPVIKHLRARFNEWVSSATLILWGTSFLLNKDLSLTLSYFARVDNFQSLVTLGAACIVLGLVRIILLIINGAWGLSPHFRVVSAGTSACIWTLMWTYFFNPDYVIPSLATIGALVALDLYSLWYAAEEARYSDVRRKKYHDNLRKN